MAAEPLIATVQLDDNSTRFFDDRRARHFPPGLNRLKSLPTLFHNLPGEKAVLRQAHDEIRFFASTDATSKHRNHRAFQI